MQQNLTNACLWDSKHFCHTHFRIKRNKPALQLHPFEDYILAQNSVSHFKTLLTTEEWTSHFEALRYYGPGQLWTTL
ncbi:hypothetical protein MHYP_G00219300 [Metynnis hypsauchen]